MVDDVINKIYEIHTTTELFIISEIEKQEIVRVSVELMESNISTQQAEIESIRIDIAGEATSILEDMANLGMKHDRLLLSGLPEDVVEEVRKTTRDVGQLIRSCAFQRLCRCSGRRRLLLKRCAESD